MGMSLRTLGLFGAAGLSAWILATVFYAGFGGRLIETAFWFYVLNAAIAAFAFSAIFRAVSRLARMPRQAVAMSALAFALPGLAAQMAVLARMDALFVQASPETLGRYCAFVVFAYALAPVLPWPARRISPGARPAR